MASRRSSKARGPVGSVRGVNDNAAASDACVTDVGAPLAYPSISPEELTLLGPLIKALALMAANDLSATTLSSDQP